MNHGDSSQSRKELSSQTEKGDKEVVLGPARRDRKNDFSSRRSLPPKRIPSFPIKLLAMLDDASECGFDDIISWLPDGATFKIHDEDKIADILPRYFKQTHYKSFVRQLQIYSFERTCRGPRKGECRHPLFFRGQNQAVITNRPIQGFKMKNIPKESSKLKQNQSPSRIRSVAIADDDDKTQRRSESQHGESHHRRRPSLGDISLSIPIPRETSIVTTTPSIENDNGVGGVVDPIPYNISSNKEYDQDHQLETLVDFLFDDNGGFGSVLVEALQDNTAVSVESDDHSTVDEQDLDGCFSSSSSSFSSYTEKDFSDDRIESDEHDIHLHYQQQRQPHQEEDLSLSICRREIISDEYMDDLLLDLI